MLRHQLQGVLEHLQIVSQHKNVASVGEEMRRHLEVETERKMPGPQAMTICQAMTQQCIYEYMKMNKE